jgi:succinate dehydrogenase / fumarate reductase membrane anchor subunit
MAAITTTGTGSEARTVRKIHALPSTASRFERGMWLFMRYSGLALVLLVLTHFCYMHLAVTVQGLTSASTVDRWGEAGKAVTFSNLAWRAYYMGILLLGMIHGLNGVRQVAYDYLMSKRALYRGFMALVSVLALGVMVMGAIALIAGARH